MVINSKKILISLFICISLASCGENGGNSPLDLDSSCNPCKMFVTASQYDGNLGGIAGADAKCNSDANNPGDGTYRALIGLANQRDGTAGAQINWVIKPNTTYTRVDGTVIAESSGDGLIPGNLTNPISGSGFEIATGLSSSGTPSAPDCVGWTSGAGPIEYTVVGRSDLSNSNWIARSTAGCWLVFLKLYCVEQ